MTDRRRTSLWTLVLLLSSVLCTPTYGQTINISIHQLDYLLESIPVEPNSEWGQIDVEYDPGPSRLWLNVVADPNGSNQWVLQNLPILSFLDVSDPLRTSSAYFNLGSVMGVSRGTDVTGSSLETLATATAVPLTTAPLAGVPGLATIGSFQALTNSGVPSGVTALNTPIPKFIPWVLPGEDFKIVLHDGMPNVVQESHFCGPGAAANSMHFLLPNDLGQTLEETQSEMATNMGNDNDGNWDDAEVSGKLKFIKDKGLPIEVHYTGGRNLPTTTDFTDPGGNGTAENNGKFTCDWLVSQLMEGQDVEIVTDSHWVVISGVARWGDACVIEYRDDPFQNGAATTQAEKDAIAKRYVYTTWDKDTNKINIGNGEEVLRAAVAESPDPHFSAVDLFTKDQPGDTGPVDTIALGLGAGPFQFSVRPAGQVVAGITSQDLPAGLSLNSTTGAISGTATVAGVSHVLGDIKDATDKIVAFLWWTIIVDDGSLPHIQETVEVPRGETIAGDSPDVSELTAKAQFEVVAGGQDFRGDTTEDLPAGVSFDPDSGALQGTASDVVGTTRHVLVVVTDMGTSNVVGFLWLEIVVIDPSDIPTLSEWGIVMLASLLLIVGVVLVSRRHRGLMAT